MAADYKHRSDQIVVLVVGQKAEGPKDFYQGKVGKWEGVCQCFHHQVAAVRFRTKATCFARNGVCVQGTTIVHNGDIIMVTIDLKSSCGGIEVIGFAATANPVRQ